MITSLYLLWPHCLGGYGNVTFTCFETEFKCCKVADRPKDLCIIQEVGCILVKPTTCLKGVTQWYVTPLNLTYITYCILVYSKKKLLHYRYL